MKRELQNHIKNTHFQLLTAKSQGIKLSFG